MIKNLLGRLLTKKSESPYTPQQYPPFVTATAALESRLRTQRRMTYGVIATCLGIVAIQQHRMGAMTDQLARSEFIVVPGAPDYMVVRPGVPPDAAVFTFANWTIDQLANFNYLDVERRYEFLAEHMSPEFRESFLMEFRKKLPRYREFTVTEIYQHPGINNYDLRKVGDQFLYVVTARGNVIRYSGDQKLGTSTREIVRLTFKTSPINRNKTFLFEVTNIERMTEEEETHLARAAESFKKEQTK